MGHAPEDDWKYDKDGNPVQPKEDEQEDQGPTRFTVNGQSYELASLDDLSFEEQELLEDAFNQPAEEIDFRRAKALRWLIYLSMHRAGTKVEFDDLKAIKFSQIADADPTPPVE